MLLSPLVVFPSVKCNPDVLLLALFRSAAKKDDNLLAVFPDIHAVTRAEMNLALKNARSHTLDVGEVPESHTL